VGLAAELSPFPIKTFSIGFEDKSYSELTHARRTAKTFGTEHHEFMVRSDVKELLPKLVWFSDEPSADSSIIPTYYLSKMTREHVKVALSGDGGDEMFGGYLTYPAFKTATLYKRLPRWLRKGILEGIARRLPVSHKKVSIEYKIKRFLTGVDLEPLRAHYWWNGAFGEDEKNELYNPWLREELKDTDTIRVFRGFFDAKPEMDVLSRLLYVDSKLYLADDILTKVDRASMANSLEVRAPILDYKLVEFAAKIPSQLKIKGGIKKYILKKATRDLLPHCTRHRSKKGFSIPLSAWLKDDLRDVVIDYLSPRRLESAGYFNPVFVERLIKDHLEEKKNNAYYLWGLLIFQIWHEMFIENSPSLS
jgi:asparagine synthase (glutamine-hydrolysing)